MSSNQWEEFESAATPSHADVIANMLADVFRNILCLWAGRQFCRCNDAMKSMTVILNRMTFENIRRSSLQTQIFTNVINFFLNGLHYPIFLFWILICAFLLMSQNIYETIFYVIYKRFIIVCWDNNYWRTRLWNSSTKLTSISYKTVKLKTIKIKSVA